MTITRAQRLAALSGAAFFVLALIGRLAYPSGPDFVDTPAKVAAFYEAHDNGVLAANLAYLIATIFLFAFAGFLRRALAKAGGDGDGLPSAVFGALVAGGAALVAAFSVDMVAALRVQDQHTIAAPVATTLWDLSHALFGLAAPTAFAAAVLGTAIVGLRTRALPAWHGAVSVVLGVALAVPPISWLALVVFLFWVLATSLVLARGGTSLSLTPAVESPR